jgi:2-C-methyl-D-erythritol 4-phosphate cytidylyltransferase
VKIGAVILGAGAGARFGGALPKQFVECAGAPLIVHAARAFREAGLGPVAAVPPSWEAYCRDHVGLPTITGGATRTDTVRCALAWAVRESCDLLFLHAANRPLLRPELVEFMARNLAGYEGLAAFDAIAGGLVDLSAGLPAERDRFRLTATPELLNVRALESSLAGSNRQYTLALEALIAAGRRVGFVTPGFPNLKVTCPEDLHAAACLLAAGLLPARPAGPFALAPMAPGAAS